MVSNPQRQKGWGKGQRKRMVSIGLPPPVAVFASPVPEPSIRCHQGHEGSRWRGDVVGNAWGEGGGGGQGPGKGEGVGCDLELEGLNFKPTGWLPRGTHKARNVAHAHYGSSLQTRQSTRGSQVVGWSQHSAPRLNGRLLTQAEGLGSSRHSGRKSGGPGRPGVGSKRETMARKQRKCSTPTKGAGAGVA